LLKMLHQVGVEPSKFYIVGRAPPFAQPTLPRGLEGLGFEDGDADRVHGGSGRQYLDSISGDMLNEGDFTAYDRLRNLMRTEHEILVELMAHDLRIVEKINLTPVVPLRLWKVVHPEGCLVKRPALDSDRMIRFQRTPGSLVTVSGEEFVGPRGDRWLELDHVKDNVKPGWLLVHGKTLGIDSALLEEVNENVSELVGPDSVFWKARVPFQVSYSTGDVQAPFKDASSRHWPMEHWAKLTHFELEFVKYDDLTHKEFLNNADVIRSICADFTKVAFPNCAEYRPAANDSTDKGLDLLLEKTCIDTGELEQIYSGLGIC